MHEELGSLLTSYSFGRILLMSHGKVICGLEL